MDELTRAAHAARLGDRQALERFTKASYADVWRLCAALVDETAADDLAQETYARAVHALGRYRGQASARTWILSIARCVCMDELRRRYRQTQRDTRLALASGDAVTAPDPAGEIEVHELLWSLDADRRAAFVLTQLFRLSYREAAAVCGCPAGTIRSRVARARDELIRLIGNGRAPQRLPGR